MSIKKSEVLKKAFRRLSDELDAAEKRTAILNGDLQSYVHGYAEGIRLARNLLYDELRDAYLASKLKQKAADNGQNV